MYGQGSQQLGPSLGTLGFLLDVRILQFRVLQQLWKKKSSTSLNRHGFLKSNKTILHFFITLLLD